MFVESPACVPKFNAVTCRPTNGGRRIACIGRGDGPVAISSAHAPSPVFRDIWDLEGELLERNFSPVTIVHLCNRLLLDLKQSFDDEESHGPLHDLEAANPQLHAVIEQCFHEHEKILAEAQQILHDARICGGGLVWQRLLNRDFARLRQHFTAQCKKELELVQHIYALDVRDSD
jgi:hypothetical protein